MGKYLYGASVQGIQDFILKTNKLAEIVGASELVEQICNEKFYEVANIKSNDANIILAAAGNIKYVFEDEEKCKAFVKQFPKIVMSMAPGITISQAVVKVEGERVTKENLNTLETKLKAQRNNVAMPIETGYMSLERARRTGGVVFGKDKNIATDKNDEATILKLQAKETKKLFSKISGIIETNIFAKDLAFEISDITASGSNSWIAVIHADGNGLGNIIQNYGDKLTELDKFKQFSEAIENATKKACQVAFAKVILVDKKTFESKKENESKKYRYPIRPIVLGGDDLTIIIRADLALEFTRIFLEQFEEESKTEFTKLGIPEIKGLTACAGIAYVKESYPLHYAMHLTEDLCKDAKKMVKAGGFSKDGDMVKSSIAFFKVQDSFIEKIEDMKARTLKALNGIDYGFGPYLLKKYEQYANLEDLNEKLEIIKVEADKNDKSKGTSKLRQLVSESFKDTATMDLMKERMKSISDDKKDSEKSFYNKLNLDNDLFYFEKKDESEMTEVELKKKTKSMLYDLIQLHGFNY
jgi:hypothetical protein